MPLSLGPQIRIGAEMGIIGVPPFPRLDFVCTPFLSPVYGCNNSNLWAQSQDGVREAPGVEMGFGLLLQPHIPSLSTLAQDGGDRSGVSRTRSSYRLLAPCRGVDTESIASHYSLSRAWELGPWNFLSGV